MPNGAQRCPQESFKPTLTIHPSTLTLPLQRFILNQLNFPSEHPSDSNIIMAQNLSFCHNNAPFFLLENLIWALSLIFMIFFFQKNYFCFPKIGKIGVKTGKIREKFKKISKKSQKIPKNSKKSQKIIGVEIFYFWTQGGARVVPGCYFRGKNGENPKKFKKIPKNPKKQEKTYKYIQKTLVLKFFILGPRGVPVWSRVAIFGKFSGKFIHSGHYCACGPIVLPWAMPWVRLLCLGPCLSLACLWMPCPWSMSMRSLGMQHRKPSLAQGLYSTWSKH